MVHNFGLARAFFLTTLALPRRLPFSSTVTSSWDAGESEVNSRPWDSEGEFSPSWSSEPSLAHCWMAQAQAKFGTSQTVYLE